MKWKVQSAEWLLHVKGFYMNLMNKKLMLPFQGRDYFAAGREKEFVLFPSQPEHSFLTTNKINFLTKIILHISMKGIYVKIHKYIIFTKMTFRSNINVTDTLLYFELVYLLILKYKTFSLTRLSYKILVEVVLVYQYSGV